MRTTTRETLYWRVAAATIPMLIALLLALHGGAAPGRAAQRPAAARGLQDSTITPAMIALGDSIFHGKVAGGMCAVCHGPAAKGVKGMAPDLTDAAWLHGDGSYDFLVGLITAGVSKPKQVRTPMLPGGGARLTPAQVRAVAAYVRSLRPPTR